MMTSIHGRSFSDRSTAWDAPPGSSRLSSTLKSTRGRSASIDTTDGTSLLGGGRAASRFPFLAGMSLSAPHLIYRPPPNVAMGRSSAAARGPPLPCITVQVEVGPTAKNYHEINKSAFVASDQLNIPDWDPPQPTDDDLALEREFAEKEAYWDEEYWARVEASREQMQQQQQQARRATVVAKESAAARRPPQRSALPRADSFRRDGRLNSVPSGVTASSAPSTPVGSSGAALAKRRAKAKPAVPTYTRSKSTGSLVSTSSGALSSSSTRSSSAVAATGGAASPPGSQQQQQQQQQQQVQRLPFSAPVRTRQGSSSQGGSMGTGASAATGAASGSSPVAPSAPQLFPTPPYGARTAGATERGVSVEDDDPTATAPATTVSTPVQRCMSPEPLVAEPPLLPREGSTVGARSATTSIASSSDDSAAASAAPSVLRYLLEDEQQRQQPQPHRTSPDVTAASAAPPAVLHEEPNASFPAIRGLGASERSVAVIARKQDDAVRDLSPSPIAPTLAAGRTPANDAATSPTPSASPAASGSGSAITSVQRFALFSVDTAVFPADFWGEAAVVLLKRDSPTPGPNARDSDEAPLSRPASKAAAPQLGPAAATDSPSKFERLDAALRMPAIREDDATLSASTTTGKGSLNATLNDATAANLDVVDKRSEQSTTVAVVIRNGSNADPAASEPRAQSSEPKQRENACCIAM